MKDKKKFLGIFIVSLFLLLNIFYSLAYSFDCIGGENLLIVRQYLQINPISQTIPKNIATTLNTQLIFPEINGQTITYATSNLPQNYKVIAELSGPAIDGKQILETTPDKMLLIPPLPLPGSYIVDNIRLTDAQGNTIIPAQPSFATIEVIDKIIVTQVTSRPLSLEEIENLGITISEENFTVYMFTIGFATESGIEHQIEVPFALDIPDGGSSGMDNYRYIPGLEYPTLDIKLFQFEKVDPEMPGLELPPIRGAIMIPGNIAFLNQFFDVEVLVTNEAPESANLYLTDVSAEIKLPFGNDHVPNSDDEPLRMAEVGGVEQSFLTAVLNQEDQTTLISPQQIGAGSFIVEGVKEGTHKVNIDITATLNGLPSGSIAIKGTAEGVVLVRNPTFSLTFSHPDIVRTGEEYSLYVTISNTSDADANLVSLTLDPANVYGATMLSDTDPDTDLGVISFSTIAAGDSATAEYRLISRQTGKVTATGFVGEGGLSGLFQLHTGVGETGIPLSPETLILPDYVNDLSEDILFQATRILGLAHSVATAPSIVLGSDIVRTSMDVVWKKAFELSEAGLRVSLLETEERSVADLMLDWHGNKLADAGFDNIFRTTAAGRDFRAAVSELLTASLADGEDGLDLQQHLGDAVQYRDNFMSVVLDTAGGAPSAAYLQLTDESGNILGRPSDNEPILHQIPHGAMYDLDGDPAESTTELALIGNPEASASSIKVMGTGDGTIHLGFLYFDASSSLKQATFRNVGVTAQTIITADYPGPGGDIEVLLDSDGDGSPDQSLAPTGVHEYDPARGPGIISAVQAPELDVNDRGKVVALLFDEYLSGQIAWQPGDLTLTYVNLEESTRNSITGISYSEDSRVALLTFQNTISPFYDYAVTVKNTLDIQGNPQTQDAITLPVEVRMDAPGGIVSGIIRSGDGRPLAGARIELKEFLSEYATPFETVTGRTTTNASGYYRFDYVRQTSRNFSIVATDPDSGQKGSISSRISVNGQHLVLNFSLLGLGSVSGTVVEDDGITPVPDALVTIKSIASPVLSSMSGDINPNLNITEQSVYTDENGKFEMYRVPVGNLSVSAVVKDGSRKGLISAYLSSAGSKEMVTVPIFGIAGSVRGRVYADDGATGAEGAIVVITSDDNKGWVDFTHTDAQGYFTFDMMPAGDFTIQFFSQATGEIGFVSGHASSGEETYLDAVLPGTATLVGTVFNAQGVPAGGAQVIIGIHLVVADENGNFVFDDVPIGEQEVAAGLPGTSYTGKATVSIGTPGEIARVNIFLEPRATVTGAVRDHQGEIISGTTVFLWKREKGEDIGFISTVTNSSGIYKFSEAPLGNYAVRVSNSDRTDGDEAFLTLVSGGQTFVQDLTLRGNGTITGVVLDPDGVSPRVSEVYIKYQRLDSYGRIEWKTTRVISDLEDENGNAGRFELNNVLVGNFEISVYNPFHSNTVAVTGEITFPGEVVDIPIVLQDSAAIEGQVFLANGERAGGGIVVTYFGGYERSVNTDVDGRYRFELIPPERFRLEVFDPVTQNRGIAHGTVSSGATAEIDIHLLGRGRVTVKVIDGDENPIVDARVSLNSGSAVAYMYDRFPAFTTDFNGEVIFENVPEGLFSVTAEDPWTLLGGSSGGLIPEDNTEASIVIVLEASGNVTGRIYTADASATVPFAQMMLKISGKPTFFATSDEDGIYAFHHVPLKDFSIEVLDPATGRGGKANEGLYYDGEDIEMDIMLLCQGTVQGHVYTSLGEPVAGAGVSLRSTTIFGNLIIQTTSTIDGTYRIPGVMEGEFEVTAIDVDKNISGQSKSTISTEGEVLDIDISLAPTASVEGNIYAADGQSTVPYAAVTLRVPSQGYTRAMVADDNGAFSFLYVPLGDFTVTAKEQGGNDGGQFIGALSEANALAVADITFIGTGTVSGKVCNNDGSVIDQVAEIKLTRSGLFNGTYYTHSDEQGDFNLTDVPTGWYSVTAWLSLDKLTATYSGYLDRDGQTQDIEVFLEPAGDVTGLVYRADGVTAAQGALVTLSGRNFKGASITLYAEVAADAFFSVDNVPLGDFTISVYDSATAGTGSTQGTLTTQSEIVDIGSITLDDSPPQVIGIVPTHGSTQVERTTLITIKFSEPVNPATVTTGTIKVISPQGPVAGVLTLSPDGTEAIFDPTDSLPEFSSISITIYKNIRDLAGRYLPSNLLYSFTTVDSTVPEVIFARLITGTVVVKFSESVVPDSGSLVVRHAATSDMVEGVVTFSDNDTVATFTPLVPFPEASDFFIEVSGFGDNFGNPQVFFNTTVSNADTLAPVITLGSVSGIDTVIEGVPIQLAAEPVNSTDVYLVDFIVEGQIVETDYDSPYTIVLAPVIDIVVTARAMDYNGNVSQEEAFTIHVNPNQAPVVTIVSPADNSTIGTSSTMTVQVAASDDLALKEIELNVSSSMLAFTEIYPVPPDTTEISHGFEFTIPAMAATGENISITVTVRDVRDVAGLPQTINLATVDKTVPATMIVSLREGGFEVDPGEVIPVAVFVEDNVSIEQIGFEISGAVEVVECRTISPPLMTAIETFDLTIPEGLPGGAAIVVKGFAVDSGGNRGESSSYRLTVKDLEPPTVEILSPVSGSSLTEMSHHTFSVSAADNCQMARVDFFINGVFVSSDYSPTGGGEYSTSFIVTGNPGENNTLTAVAYDVSDNASEAATATIEIVADTLAPTVSFPYDLTALRFIEGQIVKIWIKVEDNVKVDTARLIVNDNIVKTISALANGSHYFYYTVEDLVPDGQESIEIPIEVEVTDYSGNTDRTDSVLVTFVPDMPPEVEISEPVAGLDVPANGIFTIRASATDDVKVTQIQIKADGQILGTLPAAAMVIAYEVPESALGETLTIEAIATDSKGQASTTAVDINVIDFRLDAIDATAETGVPADGLKPSINIGQIAGLYGEGFHLPETEVVFIKTDGGQPSIPISNISSDGSYAEADTASHIELLREITTGPVYLTNKKYQIDSNAVELQIVPTITSFVTPQFESGRKAIVIGTGFEPEMKIVFTGDQGLVEVDAIVVQQGNTIAQVVIPEGAVQGPVYVRTRGGSSDSIVEVETHVKLCSMVSKVIDENDTIFEGMNIIVDGCTASINGAHEFGRVEIVNEGVLTHFTSTVDQVYRLELTVDELVIDGTSSIDVRGKGYLGGYSGDNACRYGRTLGNTIDGGSYNFSGGSYGGLGYQNESDAVNAVYGDFGNPVELGSGGGAYATWSGPNPGGNGGGGLSLHVSSIQLDGGIHADGAGGMSGCGSGGTVYIATSVLAGTGVITAAGGATTNSAGGGGRIAVYYEDISGFDVGRMSASGGTFDGSKVGGSGTVYLKASSAEYGDLIIDNADGVTAGYSTSLRSVGQGTITELAATVLTDDTADFPVPDPVTGALGLIGLEIDPNIGDDDPTTFTIIDNTATTITVDAADGDLTTVAAVGDSYIGVYTFNDLRIRNDARVFTEDNVVVHGVFELTNGGVLTANFIDLTEADDLVIIDGELNSSEPLFDNLTELTLIDDVIVLNGSLGSNMGTVRLDNSRLSTTAIEAERIVLENTSTLSHPATTTQQVYRLELTVDELVIDGTSSIDVRGKGYLGGYSGDNACRYGRTLGNTIDGGSYNFSGGSYGGLGYQNESDAVNAVYGDFGNPVELGSGGGAYATWSGPNPGGNGGGGLSLHVSSIQLDGGIHADGAGGMSGCGSGGTVYIATSVLAGTGVITAAGGATTNSAGGGGRIAVYYEDISGFDVGRMSASGGTFDGSKVGGSGTVYLKASSAEYGDLIIDNADGVTAGYSTSLRSVGQGTITELAATVLTDDTADFPVPDPVTGALGLIGLEIDPNIGDDDPTTFTIIDNTATTITVDAADGDLTTVAAVGDSYIGVYTFNDLRIRNDARVFTEDNVVVHGVFELTNGGVLTANFIDLTEADDLVIIDGELNSSEPLFDNLTELTLIDDVIVLNGSLGSNMGTVRLDNSRLSTTAIEAERIVLENTSTLSHPATTTQQVYRLELTVDELVIDGTSSIDVRGKGYLGGYSGDNACRYGRTLGNTIDGGSYNFSGGSYGGLGYQNESDAVNAVYGDFGNPVELGSGGGAYATWSGPNPGGNGGGGLSLHVSSIQLDGGIHADGAGGMSGCGSGGTVYIATSVLAGTGVITAAGGATTNSAGGGGRIAVYYEDISGFDVGRMSASGGTFDGSKVGGSGTVYLKASSAEYGDLIIDNADGVTAGYSTSLRSVGQGTITELAATVLTDDTADFPVPDPVTGALGLIGLEIDPNIGDDDPTTFTIIDNTATTITVDAADGDLTTVAAVGDSYIGVYTFNDLRIRNDARVFTEDNVVVHGVFELTNGGVLTANYIDVTQADDLVIVDGELNSSEPLFDNLAELTLIDDVIVLNGSLGSNMGTVRLDNSRLSTTAIEAERIVLENTSTLSHPATTTQQVYRLELTVDELVIDGTSRIDVSGKGYLGGYSGDNLGLYGMTLGNTTTGGSEGYSGASYGGLGYQNESDAVNAVYGDFGNPVELGSGGGAYANYWGVKPGGNGGGGLILNASSIQLDGGIHADGAGGMSGCGSGGTVYIATSVLAGTGVITAAGGATTNSAGGGGRIAVYYEDISGFDVGRMSASGGTFDGSKVGGSGTVYLKASSAEYGDLIIDNADGVTAGYSTSLRSVGQGTITELAATVLTDDTADFPVPDPVTGALGLIGLEIDPNIGDDDPTTFTIIDNTATTITVDAADGDLTTVAAVGDSYIGVYTFNDLRIRNDARVFTEDNVVVHGVFELTNGGVLTANYIDVTQADDLVIVDGELNSSEPLFDNLAELTLIDDVIVLNGSLGSNMGTVRLDNSRLSTTAIEAERIVLENTSTLSHPATTTQQVYRLELTVDELVIDGTSRIDVSGKGYLGGYSGDNLGLYGMTLGNTTTGGSEGYSGASYGGLGYQNESDAVNAVYGDFGNPVELGSGGGAYANYWGVKPGGNGGGGLILNASSIQLDGGIHADGAGGMSGCGSGGTVYIATSVLAGTGVITAAGGATTNSAGGGGRIAVYYEDISGFDVGRMSASGGTFDGSKVGGSGTVYLKASSAEYGDLIIDNADGVTAGYSTSLRSVGQGTITELAATVLTDDTADFPVPDPVTGALGLIGLEIDPNIGDDDPTTFTIIDNTATTITVDAADGDLTTVAAVGDSYIGVYTFNDLRIRNDARVFTEDNVVVHGVFELTNGGVLTANYIDVTQADDLVIVDGELNSSEPLFDNLAELTLIDDVIVLNGSLGSNMGTVRLDNSRLSTTAIEAERIVLENTSTLSHPATTTQQVYRLELTVDELVIDGTSRIDVSGKGYLGGGRGDNSSVNGMTLGNTTTGGSEGYSGASYGGLGCQGYSYFVNDVYGDYRNPNESGSGGGGGSGSGGSGGGLVRINAGSVTIDGHISAGGESDYITGGSGGGIYIYVQYGSPDRQWCR